MTNHVANKQFNDYMNDLTMQKMCTAPTYEIKTNLTTDDIKKTMDAFKNTKIDPAPDEPVEPKEEWVWITGYKGTGKDMKCRDYQYELGKLHQMPEDAIIEDCKSGFHLCLNMKDVRRYYEIGNGRRYFEVQALVRKRDLDMYGKEDKIVAGNMYNLYSTLFINDPVRDKLAAKSIIFTRELTLNEILKGTEAETWPIEYKQMAVMDDLVYARNAMHTKELAELGYSEAFAKYITENGGYEIAKQVASQKDLSMDMKVLCILRGI